MSEDRVTPADNVLRSGPAAEWIGMSPKELSRLARAGQIPMVKIGAKRTGYRLRDLNRFLVERGEFLDD